jgi:hypothetical protein
MVKNDKDHRPTGGFSEGNQYRMKKGETKNPKGRPKGRSIRGRLREILDSEGGENVIEQLLTTALDEAKGGDFRFWKEIADSIDGKIPDRIAGHDGGPVKIDDETRKRMDQIIEAANKIHEE